MVSNDLRGCADPVVVRAWITGWTVARETALPVEVDGGFRVDVGWPRQRVRYVFPSCCEELRRLAKTIVEPWVLLKVCAEPDEMRPLLPPRWTIQPLGYMMTCSAPIDAQPHSVPAGYSLDAIEGQPVSIATIRSADGGVAASGRVAIAGTFAIYDRIETSPNQRRRGLGRAIVSALEAIALERGATQGILVATQDGRALYESLGWDLHSPYTTAVIPGTID